MRSGDPAWFEYKIKKLDRRIACLQAKCEEYKIMMAEARTRYNKYQKAYREAKKNDGR